MGNSIKFTVFTLAAYIKYSVK